MTVGDFEWDDAKAKASFKKHAIHFEDAVTAFADPTGFEVLDDRFDYGEERWVWFGRLEMRIIVVAIAYSERRRSRRIISARPATADEEATYWSWASPGE